MIVVLAGNYPIARLHYFSACCLQPCSAAAALPSPRRASPSFILSCLFPIFTMWPALFKLQSCLFVCLFRLLQRKIKQPFILEMNREMWCLLTGLHYFSACCLQPCSAAVALPPPRLAVFHSFLFVSYFHNVASPFKNAVFVVCFCLRWEGLDHSWCLQSIIYF